MQNVSTQPFVSLIATRLGLRVRQQEESTLRQKLLKRVHALGLPSLEAYYQFLVFSRSTVEDAEWQRLIEELTVNESYFFRDQGQFSLLRNQILPELLNVKRSLSASERTLRVWSAGCSTGEEAYSLAILLKELIPEEQAWNLLVLGTDINELALAQAKRGIYSDWSFRSVNPAIQKKYFRPHHQGWEVAPHIRSMVTFQTENLVHSYHSGCQSEIHSLDLILCRNVFIYFDAEAIAHVLDRFYQALTPSGYLITGHTELHQQNLNQFRVKTFPESVIYQRRAKVGEGSAALQHWKVDPCSQSSTRLFEKSESQHSTADRPSHASRLGSAETQSPLALGEIRNDGSVNLAAFMPLLSNTGKFPPHLSPAAERTDQPLTASHSPALSNPVPIHALNHAVSNSPILLDDVNALIDRKAYAEAIDLAKRLLAQQSTNYKIHYLMAEAYANLGDYPGATAACQQALQLNPFAVEPIYLLAQIAQEQGDLEGAKNLLKRVIYLAPASAYAYFELGCLYEQQGNMAKAQRNWRSTLDGLKQTPQQATVDLRKNVTTAELQAAVEQKLMNKN